MRDHDENGRRESEEAVRAEAAYQALRQSTSDGLYVFHGTRCVDCNEKAAEILGWPIDEIMGVPPWSRKLSPPTQPDGRDSREKGEDFMARAGAGECLVFDWVHTRSDGSLVDVEVGLHSVQKDDETFVVALLRDVSARKSAEEALRVSEQKFASAFHASPSSVVIVSLVDYRFIEVNDSFERVSGYTRDEAIGKTGVELGMEEPGQLARLVELFRGGEPFRDIEARYTTKSGKVRIVELSAEAIETAGEPCVVVVSHDITERRQAEDERRRAFEEIARLKEELERERDYLREEVDVSLHFGEIIGGSTSLGRVLAQVEAVAGTNANVLITGETGVGKELITRAIHSKSQRTARPLVKVNCSSVPRELFESEFFGHVKGAFTGAHRDRVGRFELADGGTLFLDEVAEIPMELQSKLLRVLQEGEFERVGDETTREVDVRLIASTNRDLKIEAQEGRFREDLYYRLSVFPISVPPLRERGDDVVALARHFIDLACRELGRSPMAISRAQVDALRAYEWPGNIRELRNVIERAVILSSGTRLRLDQALPEAMLTANNHLDQKDTADRERDFMTSEELEMLERRNLVAALEHAGWKVSGPGGAAELLGLKPSTLAYQMKRLGIAKP